MKIASTTGDFRPLPTEDHVGRVRHVARAGFQYIDLSFYDIDKKTSPFMTDERADCICRLQSCAEELCVRYVQAHLPNCNPLDDGRFDEYVACTVRAIEACGALGIRNAVIHTGWRAGIGKEEYFELNRRALSPLFPAMEANGVNVLIENTTKANIKDYYFTTGAEMKEFIAFVGHPLLHACWDVGHANIERGQYEDIAALGDDLRAIHVHDNNGRADQHVAPFTGTLNMDELIAALNDTGYGGYFTFEADCTVSRGKTWQMDRRTFARDTRLFDPPLAVYDAAERLLFEIGKSCLSAYGIYEEMSAEEKSEIRTGRIFRERAAVPEGSAE